MPRASQDAGGYCPSSLELQGDAHHCGNLFQSRKVHDQLLKIRFESSRTHHSACVSRMNPSRWLIHRRGNAGKSSRHLALAFIATALFAASGAGAESVYEASPDNYRRLIRLLGPGDTLALSAGEYREGLQAHNLSGEPGRPIIISGPQRGPAATFIARPGHNTVSIADSRYLVISNLVLEGDNLPVDGVKAEKQSRWTHDITLENLVIRGHGNNQQTVGISTKCPAWNWVIRGNTITGAGTGIYLGNSDGSAPFVAGLIERNVIVDTIGYSLQIKHQQPRPRIADMPETPSITIIRRNTFSKARGGSAGPDARPNVLLGHLPLSGAGVDDRYAVYGNLFYENPNESLLQAEGNVSLYNNLFINSGGNAIRIQPHNDVPREVNIFWNTVVARDLGVTVSVTDDRFRRLVTGNAVFAESPIQGGEQRSNITGSLSDAAVYLKRPFALLEEADFSPLPGRLDIASSSGDEFQGLPDWNYDFLGILRSHPVAGAYGGGAGVNGASPLVPAQPASRK
jgi:hypothetical protein